MLKIYTCIAYAHDLRLVVLAALICVLASLAAINLLHHARRSQGHLRLAWLAVSAISTGFGIWATHFVAMLAFTPGIPSGYNIALTVMSLVAAMLLTGSGLAVSLIANWRHGPWLGGAVVAGGIAAMHIPAWPLSRSPASWYWDPVLVVASIVAGAVISAIASGRSVHSPRAREFAGAVPLDARHRQPSFHGDGRVSIIPDPTMEISPSALPADGWRSVALCELCDYRVGAGRRRARYRDRRRSET